VAVFITNPNDTALSPHEVDFAAIWKHYLRAKFLYPKKLERLKPAMGRINEGWPKLLASPADVFQLHLAACGTTILSSVCAFRDPGETSVIQHAVSQDHPQLMIECLLSFIATSGKDPGAQLGAMYFRPENRWPVRLVGRIREVLPPELTNLRTWEYLTCDPKATTSVLPTSAKVEELEEDANPEVSSIAVAALGHLRATASGIGVYQYGNAKTLKEHYARFGLLRGRKTLGALRDGTVAGIALCYVSGFPMNFSSLCSRVEILVHPEAPDRANVVRDLARAAIREAALREEPVCALLIDGSDAQAAVTGGFNNTTRQYSSFLWARESAAGWPAIANALEQWYARISRRYAGTSQRIRPAT
jgi:hypothetical protein